MLVPDDQRRSRLALRHALVSPVDTPEAATRVMTVLHATEAATVPLSCWARVSDVRVADVDRALYADRTLVKQLAMRRTLFVFPRDLLPAVWGSASARVAGIERARMVKDIEQAGIAADWFDRARSGVFALLADAPDGLTTVELRQALPDLDEKVTVGPGDVWLVPRLLNFLGAAGAIVRATGAGRWAVNKPRWALTRHWLGDVPAPLDPAAGYLELVRRWLWTFGPGTEDDLVWWLGATRSAVRAALAGLDAVPVALDGGATGHLLPDDLDPVPDPGPWVALLPVLDPTVMGWRGRDFYLGPHRDQLFDSRGNAGTTAWVDGRAVGCWVQDDAGAVRVHVLERVPARARRALDAEAARLTQWLGGLKIGSVYSSPAMKSGRASSVTGSTVPA